MSREEKPLEVGKSTYVVQDDYLQRHSLLQEHNDQEGVRSTPDTWAMVDNFLVSAMVSLGHQQAVVAALVDPDCR